MTTTNAERVRRYKARQRGEYVPELHRGAPLKKRVVVEYAPPPDPPLRLRQAQRVTWWNVVTGRVEETLE